MVGGDLNNNNNSNRTLSYFSNRFIFLSLYWEKRGFEKHFSERYPNGGYILRHWFLIFPPPPFFFLPPL